MPGADLRQGRVRRPEAGRAPPHQHACSSATRSGAAVHEGRGDFTPCFLSEVPLLFKNGHPAARRRAHPRQPARRARVLLVRRRDRRRRRRPRSRRKIVIAEVNPKMPRTLGDAFIHVSKIHHIVEVDYPLPSVQHGGHVGAGPADRARTSRALIPDGATLQTGIGAIPDAVLRHADRPQAPGRAHRAVLGRRHRPGGAGRHRRRDEDAAPGQDHRGVHGGHAAALRLRARQPDHRDAPDRVRQRPVHRRAERPDGRHQLGDRGGPDRPGVRRQHRPAHLQRGRRAGGHDLRRVAEQGRRAHHRAAVDGRREGADTQQDRADAQAGRGRRHHAATTSTTS